MGCCLHPGLKSLLQAMAIEYLSRGHYILFLLLHPADKIRNDVNNSQLSVKALKAMRKALRNVKHFFIFSR